MERLTHWNGKKYVLTHGQGFGQTRVFTDKLAEYENTQLEPEEVEELKQAYARLYNEWLKAVTADD